MGRFGNTLLINDQEDFTLQVNQGEITRLYLTNVANTRTFDVLFTGAITKLVGGDNGRIEHEVVANDFILGPSERSVLEVLYEKPGTYPIMHRGKKMGTVVVNAGEVNHVAGFKQLRNSASDYSTIRANINSLLAQKPDKRLRLDIEMKGVMGDMMQDMGNGNGSGMTMSNGTSNDDMMREHCQMMPEMAGCEAYLISTSSKSVQADDGIEWEDNMMMMNQMSTNENIKWTIEDQDTNKQNHEIDWSFKKGQLVKVQIYNDEKGMHPMQHPIHFHGQRFVVLARDGVVNDNLQWKDTVLIPKGQTIDILIDMSNPGKWMAHCHIAEHLESGMMFDFEVN
jgi:suppressor of ftsI